MMARRRGERENESWDPAILSIVLSIVPRREVKRDTIQNSLHTNSRSHQTTNSLKTLRRSNPPTEALELSPSSIAPSSDSGV